MNAFFRKISIIFIGLLLIASCGKKAEDATTTTVVANNEAQVASVNNGVNKSDTAYEDQYAKIFPKDDPKTPARKLAYEKGSLVTKNWDNEDFAECFVSVIRLDDIAKQSPEEHAKDIEMSKNLQLLMSEVVNIKIIYKEVTQQQLMNMVENINSQIPEGEHTRKSTVWYGDCIKKTLEVSGAMNNS